MRMIIYLEQYAKNLLSMSNCMCGKFSASVQLHGHSFMVNISNSGGDIAYIFITIIKICLIDRIESFNLAFLTLIKLVLEAFPNSAKTHKLNNKLVSAFLNESSILTPLVDSSASSLPTRSILAIALELEYFRIVANESSESRSTFL